MSRNKKEKKPSATPFPGLRYLKESQILSRKYKAKQSGIQQQALTSSMVTEGWQKKYHLHFYFPVKLDSLDSL